MNLPLNYSRTTGLLCELNIAINSLEVKTMSSAVSRFVPPQNLLIKLVLILFLITTSLIVVKS